MSLRRITLAWFVAMFVLFPVLAILGLMLRAGQGNWHNLPPDFFYASLTLHGLGMVGLWFVAAMAGTSLSLSRYVRVSAGVSTFVFAATLVGIVLLITCTLIGRFGTGWYFLYPLPLYSLGVWPAWATWMFFIGLGILGAAWTLWALDLLCAMAGRYSLRAALGWQYLSGKNDPEVPPLIVITTVSLIAGLAGLVSAVIVLALFFTSLVNAAFTPDALLMKNLTFLFGHLLVNITLYLGVGLVYELMPGYCGRPWKTNKYVALAWNAVLLLVILAYFHHLYMDFVQVRALQIIGQVASYLTSIPAAVVTIFGLLALLLGARTRWTLTSLLLFLGVLGWTIGGIGAVIDSTIAANVHFHNTLWVPAHFHTYFLMGVVLMLLGAVHHVCQEFSQIPEKARLARLTVTLIVIGGYGFLLMFYLGGAQSIPRRYATYAPDLAAGVTQARAATLFGLVFLVGLVLYLWQTGRCCFKALAR